jgi:hypothetical protein
MKRRIDREQTFEAGAFFPGLGVMAINAILEALWESQQYIYIVIGSKMTWPVPDASILNPAPTRLHPPTNLSFSNL